MNKKVLPCLTMILCTAMVCAAMVLTALICTKPKDSPSYLVYPSLPTYSTSYAAPKSEQVPAPAEKMPAPSEDKQ